MIHGEPYAMTASSRAHQMVVGEIYRQISNYLYGKSCDPYVLPFDVRLPNRDEADEEVDTVVQPDIAVVCDSSKLDDAGCRGAPEWMVEVLLIRLGDGVHALACEGNRTAPGVYSKRRPER